jgi:hypothetical protein
MVSQIFVNLPVKDLDKSVAFYKALGFSFNPQFTDETAACMVMSDSIYAMLLTEAKFATFTPNPLSDAKKNTEVLVAVSLENRAAVEEIIRRALAAGGSTYSEPQDYGFMYQHGFQDLDGHIWEPFYMDPSFVQANDAPAAAAPQPRIVTKPAFTVVGMRINTTPKSPEIPALWDKLVPRMGEIQHGDEGRVSYGVMEGMSDHLVYMAGNPVTRAADLPAGMTHWDVPANTYAVFEATLATIGETFGKAHAWVASSDYQLGSGPHLERYGEDFSPDNPRLDILIPVAKKA